jgi:uncharacterized protein (UPF0332 family)
MTFDLATYLNLAEEILELDKANDGHDNAYLRCSISRAYYSVFCIARNFKGLKHYWGPADEPFHIAVLDKYRTSGGRNKKIDKRIWQLLDYLRKLRVSADYHEEHTLTKEKVRDGVEKARECYDKLVGTYGDDYNFS